MKNNHLTSSLEPLESRIAPAVFIVTSAADNGAAGTLRTEIGLANSAGGSNTIVFAKALFAKSPAIIPLSSSEGGQISITSNLTIKGPGAGNVIIDGQNSSRIFSIGDDTVSISGISMVDGSVTGSGGAISSAGPLTISNCIISGNSVTSGFGGGIYDNSSGAFVLKNTFVTGNKSSDNGGGAWVEAGNGITISNSLVKGNSAGTYEGGLRLYIPPSGTGNLVISGSTISGNTAADGVGAVYIDNKSNAAAGKAEVEITHSIFSGNAAGTHGGGLYLTNASNSPAAITSVVISNNTAASGNGGGMVDLSTQPLVIANSRITGNSSNGNGGGIYSFGAHSLTIVNSTISDNVAGDSGGILVLGGNFTMKSSVISENRSTTSAIGGLGLNSTSGVTNISGSTIANNTSASNAGGVFLGGSGAITIQSTKIIGNVAQDGVGGGMFVGSSSPSIKLQNLTVAQNTAAGGATSDGGGIDLAGTGTFTLIGGSVTANNATGDGGGIYVDTAAIGTIQGTSVTGNAADELGGGFAHLTSSTGTVHITKPSLITGNVGALGKTDIYGEYIKG